MNTYTVTDPRTGETITRRFKTVKGAVMFDWGYNPATRKNDLPTVSFFKDLTAAHKAVAGRVNGNVTIQVLA